MTLEDAIKHAEAVAQTKEREAKENRNHGGWAYDDEAKKCSDCAAEHRQLAEWLKELKERREQDVPDKNVGKIDKYGYIGIETLLNFCENSKDHAVTPNDFMRMKRVRMPEPCEDAVSRKDAIRWVKTECNPYGKPTLDFESGKKVIEHLKRMSPVTPKRKTGGTSRSIDGSALIMWLNDWWASSFGQEETPEAKAIREVLDKVVEYIESERK